jgi:DNA-binding NtrC family response regulator
MNSLALKTPSPQPGIPMLLIGPAGSRRYVLHSMLRSPQWEIREASHWGEAARILDERHAGVVICDTEVPDGGWQALLLSLQDRANPPRLIVSARLADERLWAEVLNLGGYDVLVEPFDRTEVLRVAQMAWMSWQHGQDDDRARRPAC